MMQIDQIVEDFAIRNRMPEEAIRAATDQADIVVPAFIDYIENCPAHGPFDAGEETTVFLMFHVLGSLRAKAAYRPLARLVNRNDADLDWFIGYDAIFETSHRVIAPLVDGDPKPLYDVIENRDAGEFIRAAMLRALAMAARDGALQRHETANYLRDCFMNMWPQDESPIWFGWQNAILILGLSELTPLVEKAFARGYVETFFYGFTDFEDEMKLVLDNPALDRVAGHHVTPFGDVIEEMSTWVCFNEERRDAERREPLLLPTWDAAPKHNPNRHTGRNDPCPCGSGKKYKKCCLEAQAA